MKFASIGHCNCSSEHMQYVGVEPFASYFLVFILVELYIMQVYTICLFNFKFVFFSCINVWTYVFLILVANETLKWSCYVNWHSGSARYHAHNCFVVGFTFWGVKRGYDLTFTFSFLFT